MLFDSGFVPFQRLYCELCFVTVTYSVFGEVENGDGNCDQTGTITTSVAGAFPNPSSDVFNIVLPEASAKAIVTSADGNLIAIDVTQLVSGSYYIVVDTDNSRYTKQLLKE